MQLKATDSQSLAWSRSLNYLNCLSSMPWFRLCSHLRLFCQLVAIQANANSKAKCTQCNGEKNTTTVPPNDIIRFLQVGCLCHCCPLPTPHGYTQNTEQQVLRLLVLKPHMHILYAFIALVYIVWHQYRGSAQPGMSLKNKYKDHGNKYIYSGVALYI